LALSSDQSFSLSINNQQELITKNYAVDYGESANITICIGGDVAEELVLLQSPDTLETVVSSRTIRDRIAGDTLGIKLVLGTQMTAYDNQ
jgi:hypothetical protein